MNLMGIGASLLLPVVSSSVSKITGMGSSAASSKTSASSVTGNSNADGDSFEASLLATMMGDESQQLGSDSIGAAMGKYIKKASQGTATEADYKQMETELAQLLMQRAESRNSEQNAPATYLNSAMNAYNAQVYFGADKLL